MPKTKEVTFSIPGWASWTLTPNVVEKRAAWMLYVELSTRVTAQPLDRGILSVRAALDSLHKVFLITREVLNEAGPEVARCPDSFGPIAIKFLREVLSPFLLRWHEELLYHESHRPEGLNAHDHEEAFPEYDTIRLDLTGVQEQTQAYIESLAKIADVYKATST